MVKVQNGHWATFNTSVKVPLLSASLKCEIRAVGTNSHAVMARDGTEAE